MNDFSDGYRKFEPTARPGTRFRIVGPLTVKGMKVWRIFAIGKGGKGGEKVGPDHFSYEAARDELKALVSGKRVFYYEGVGFEHRKL